MKRSLLILFCFSVLFHSCKKEEGHQPYLIDSLSQNTQFLIEVSGFENTDGNLAISISSNSTQFDSETQTYRDTVINIVSSNMNITIDGITAGTYAVSVFYDENQNNTLDFAGVFGIPQEGFGFSNNPDIGFSKPDFNDCKFVIENGQTLVVPITLEYF